MHTQIINGREVLTVPTVIGYKHYDLEKREVVGEVIESTYRRKDGTMYIIRRSRTEREKAAIRACLTGDISMSKQQKSPAWHAEQVGNSPKLLLKLYHECLEI